MALLALITVLMGLPAISLASESPMTTAPMSPSGRPALMITATDPVTVEGRGFKAAERVSVTGNGRRKSILAGPRGGFTIVFAEANACNGFTAVARGSKGSRASLKSAQFSNVHCLEPQSPQFVPASSTATPALRVLTREPLAVRGTGFRPAEKVRVTALGSIKRLVRQTTADERGAFKASFRLGADRTSHLVVAAVGSHGSRATVTVKPRYIGPPPRE
jgi:hypothetical protein